jgi:hypothetical protein
MNSLKDIEKAALDAERSDIQGEYHDKGSPKLPVSHLPFPAFVPTS